MNVDGKAYRSIWYEAQTDSVRIIDQTVLPHQFRVLTLKTLADACHAIRSMQVRGAPLIGVTAAFGLYLALKQAPNKPQQAIDQLLATRPTAVNLSWALAIAQRHVLPITVADRAARALQLAQEMADRDVATCEAIGEYGADILESLWREKSARQTQLQILTHCNAGALATVDWGTALAVIYKAQRRDIPLHVWVDETRPRNQGAALTCWELKQQDVDCSLIVDNAGGHLMQRGLVDICIVGSDRTTADGDVCNKIGTYLKALAAYDNQVPFYAALPVSTIDFELHDGVREIPIEQRDSREVTHISGLDSYGRMQTVQLAVDGVKASNYGFDVTPARLMTGLITEKGVYSASRQALAGLPGSR